MSGQVFLSLTSTKQGYMCPGGGGGGNLIFSYIRRLGSFFGVKILNFNIFGVFQKNKYFLGVMILWIFFGGSSQNWTIFWGHFYAFYGLFLRSRYRMWG